MHLNTSFESKWLALGLQGPECCERHCSLNVGMAGLPAIGISSSTLDHSYYAVAIADNYQLLGPADCCQRSNHQHIAQSTPSLESLNGPRRSRIQAVRFNHMTDPSAAFDEWNARKAREARELRTAERHERAAALGVLHETESVATLDTATCVMIRYRRDLERRERAHACFMEWMDQKEAQARSQRMRKGSKHPTIPLSRSALERPRVVVPKMGRSRRQSTSSTPHDSAPLQPPNLGGTKRQASAVSRPSSARSSASYDSELAQRARAAWRSEVTALLGDVAAESRKRPATALTAPAFARSMPSGGASCIEMASSTASLPAPRRRARVPPARKPRAPGASERHMPAASAAPSPTAHRGARSRRSSASSVAVRLLESPLVEPPWAGSGSAGQPSAAEGPAQLGARLARLRRLAVGMSQRGLLTGAGVEGGVDRLMRGVRAAAREAAKTAAASALTPKQ